MSLIEGSAADWLNVPFFSVCGLDHLGVVKVPSKSTLQRFHEWTDVETLKRVNLDLIKSAAKTPEANEAHGLDLMKEIELETIWLDSTALKAKVHYPVD